MKSKNTRAWPRMTTLGCIPALSAIHLSCLLSIYFYSIHLSVSLFQSLLCMCCHKHTHHTGYLCPSLSAFFKHIEADISRPTHTHTHTHTPRGCCVGLVVGLCFNSPLSFCPLLITAERERERERERDVERYSGERCVGCWKETSGSAMWGGYETRKTAGKRKKMEKKRQRAWGGGRHRMCKRYESYVGLSEAL